MNFWGLDTHFPWVKFFVPIHLTDGLEHRFSGYGWIEKLEAILIYYDSRKFVDTIDGHVSRPIYIYV